MYGLKLFSRKEWINELTSGFISYLPRGLSESDMKELMEFYNNYLDNLNRVTGGLENIVAAHLSAQGNLSFIKYSRFIERDSNGVENAEYMLPSFSSGVLQNLDLPLDSAIMRSMLRYSLNNAFECMSSRILGKFYVSNFIRLCQSNSLCFCPELRKYNSLEELLSAITGIDSDCELLFQPHIHKLYRSSEELVWGVYDKVDICFRALNGIDRDNISKYGNKNISTLMEAALEALKSDKRMKRMERLTEISLDNFKFDKACLLKNNNALLTFNLEIPEDTSIIKEEA